MNGNDGFFGWLGERVGGAIRFIVDGLRAVFGGLADALNAFFGGVADAFGMSRGWFNYVWLAIGVLMLVAAVRALLRRAILAAVIWALLGVFVLGMLTG